MGSQGSRRTRLAAAAVLVLVVGCGAIPPSAPPSIGPSGSPSVSAITEDGLRTDLAMLANASATSPAFRSLGSPGFDAAVAAVEGILRSAGWSVHEDSFSAPAFADDGATTISVGGQTFGGAEVRPLIYSPAGTAEGPVVVIGWPAGAAAPNGQGCATADYGTLPAHAIVVVGRGDCYRRQAVTAAEAAGAAGFVALGPGTGPPLRPTLLTPSGIGIPVVSVSADVASALRTAAGAGGTARIASTAKTGPTTTRSVIAELPGSTPSVVMLGAHLDSVIDGPGVNDNGSGVAALLELARALAGTHPQATIRLAFWAAEEEGLLGSAHYVRGLSAADRSAIVAYLNADMIASPNGYAGVYDEAGSPAGSDAVRGLLVSSLSRLGVTASPADTGGGSDHVPFGQAGIPVGGVFSGASDLVTEPEAQTFGAAASQPADSCYHQACDGPDNVKLRLGRALAAALADTALQIAADPTLVSR
jgi:aminopeptidase Y